MKKIYQNTEKKEYVTPDTTVYKVMPYNFIMGKVVSDDFHEDDAKKSDHMFDSFEEE